MVTPDHKKRTILEDLYLNNQKEETMSLGIVRRFSESDPFNPAQWTLRTAQIRGADGKAVHYKEKVLAPTAWSDRAVTITDSKYCKGTESVQGLIRRVVDAITTGGVAGGYFDEATSIIFRDELATILVDQRASFNSPVWFNVGRVAQPQSSACFILSVEDSMEGIMRLIATEARLFRGGSGCGSNLSAIRSSREKIAGGGIASGPVSFMRGLDASAGAIKSGGITRRAAKMVVLNSDHPDIVEFATCKLEAERDARALRAAGRGGTLDQPSVFFQNANNSVRATDAFMQAVDSDLPWELRAVTTGEVVETVSAKALFQTIAQAAWECGDPGMQFHDTTNTWHTCPHAGNITGSNPCSEYMFLEDSACNLASINLLTFLNETGQFDTAGFVHTVRIMILAQEILVGISGYPTEKIRENSLRHRPLGLGYANLGATLMCLGLPYDSPDGRSFAASVTALMTGAAYAHSAEIAKDLGHFEGYNPSPFGMLGVIDMHAEEVGKISPTSTSAPIIEAAQAAWKTAQRLGKKHGFRNAQATVLAPTGTIAFMMDCETTGIEPAIALVAHKQLVGGGTERLVISTVERALGSLGYDTNTARAIMAHTAEHGEIDGAPGFKQEHLPVFATAIGKHTITPEGHLAMMAAVQPFLSGAISKTVNLPSTATVDDVGNIYMRAWKLGLKAVAIYRDGSKDIQPVTTQQTHPLTAQEQKPARRRMPTTRNSLTHAFNIDGHKGYITVGLYEDGSPGEVFINMAKEGSTIGGMMDAFAIAVSIALQHGVPLGHFARKFAHSRFEPSGWTGNPDIPMAKSIVDYIFRWLAGNFLSPEEAADIGVRNGNGHMPETVSPKTQPSGHTSDSPACHVCGSIMIRSGSCYACPTCATTSGCS